MVSISLNPSTFAYICSEHTIFPAIVLEHEGIKVTFQGAENKADEKKLVKFIKENF